MYCTVCKKEITQICFLLGFLMKEIVCRWPVLKPGRGFCNFDYFIAMNEAKFNLINLCYAILSSGHTTKKATVEKIIILSTSYAITVIRNSNLQ